MEWNQALKKILKNVNLGDDLSPTNNYRLVTEVPKKNQIKSDPYDGFIVQIGATTFIDISLIMLEKVFNSTLKNNNLYKKSVFHELYPRECNNHGCYVHSVGALFEKADVMTKVDARTYSIN